MRGVCARIAFREDALYEDLWSHLMQGWALRKTRLTEGYSCEKYLAECVAGTLQLLAIHADGKLLFHSLNTNFVPKPGDTVINFGPPRSEVVREAVPEIAGADA